MNRLRGDPPASPQTDAQGDASADAEGYLLESVELLSVFFARALKILGNVQRSELNWKWASNIFENDAVIYIHICVCFGWNDHWWTLERLPTLAPLRWFLYPFQESFGHAWFLSQIQHSNLENDDISYLTWFLSIINHPPVITILWVL